MLRLQIEGYSSYRDTMWLEMTVIVSMGFREIVHSEDNRLIKRLIFSDTH